MLRLSTQRPNGDVYITLQPASHLWTKALKRTFTIALLLHISGWLVIHIASPPHDRAIPLPFITASAAITPSSSHLIDQELLEWLDDYLLLDDMPSLRPLSHYAPDNP
jgi:hypothetical protein